MYEGYDRREFRVDTWRAGKSTSVTLVHLPSGLAAGCHEHPNAMHNAVDAWELLKPALDLHYGRDAVADQ
jgi:hypothetical protein